MTYRRLAAVKRGKSMPRMSALGVGTIWFGMPWPPNEKDRYNPPLVEEISTFLEVPCLNFNHFLESPAELTL